MAKKSSDQSKYTKQRKDTIAKAIDPNAKVKKHDDAWGTLDKIYGKLPKKAQTTKRRGVVENRETVDTNNSDKAAINRVLKRQYKDSAAKKAKIAYQTKETPTKAVKAKK